MKVGSLFSGIGGFDKGLEDAGFEIAWQVENDDYCREVLKKHWPKVPCHYDITAIDWYWVQRVDLICAGWPCQPFSCAGKRQGQDDSRYLWPEVARCLQGIRPTWFLGENVPGFLHLGFEQMCADLESLGYQAQAFAIPACAVDAPHIRQRLWVVAHTNSDTLRAQPGRIESGRTSAPEPRNDGQKESVAHANGERFAERRKCNGQQEKSGIETPQRNHASGCGEIVADTAQQLRNGGRKAGPQRRNESANGSSGRSWVAEPRVGRVANGIPHRVDRLSALGNSLVPQIAEAFGRMILKTMEEA